MSKAKSNERKTKAECCEKFRKKGRTCKDCPFGRKVKVKVTAKGKIKIKLPKAA